MLLKNNKLLAVILAVVLTVILALSTAAAALTTVMAQNHPHNISLSVYANEQLQQSASKQRMLSMQAASNRQPRRFFEIRIYHRLDAADRADILAQLAADRLRINTALVLWSAGGAFLYSSLHIYSYIGRRSAFSCRKGGILYSFDITERYISVVFYREIYPIVGYAPGHGIIEKFHFPGRDMFNNRQDLEFGTNATGWRPSIGFVLEGGAGVQARTITVNGVSGIASPPLRRVWWLIARHDLELIGGNDYIWIPMRLPAQFRVGQTLLFNALVNPPELLLWLSGDMLVANVTQMGLVTAISTGTTRITARFFADASVYTYFYLTVLPALEEPPDPPPNGNDDNNGDNNSDKGDNDKQNEEDNGNYRNIIFAIVGFLLALLLALFIINRIIRTKR